MKTLVSLGNKIRLARMDKQISQTELAYRIGKDQPSINRVERGNVNPTYLFLLTVCEGLEITLPDLLRLY